MLKNQAFGETNKMSLLDKNFFSLGVAAEMSVKLLEDLNNPVDL